MTVVVDCAGCAVEISLEEKNYLICEPVWVEAHKSSV